MICIAKPYERRISPRLAVWAFKRTGLKPTTEGDGDLYASGCLLSAIAVAVGTRDVGRMCREKFDSDYYSGIIYGWDHPNPQTSSHRQTNLGVKDAIAARAALTEAGIV